MVSQDDLKVLVEEYRATYLHGEAESVHKRLLLKARREGRLNYEKALQLKAQGRDYTDAVLYGLLPHLDSNNNREKGSWIHIAPCVTKDIKEWFEGGKWAKPEDWPRIAERLLEFFQSALADPAAFPALCAKLAANPLKGFQVGFLTPILNALDPEHFLVVNKKPVMAMNWMTGSRYKARLEDLSAVMAAIRGWVESNRALMESITLPETSVFDAFDTFSHWLKAEKGVYDEDDAAEPEKETAPLKKLPLFERYGRGKAEASEETFRRIFPGEENRKAAEAFLVRCVRKANAGNDNNWQITKGRLTIRFNVGFCRVLRFDRTKFVLFMLSKDMPESLRERHKEILNIGRHFRSLGPKETGKVEGSPDKFAEVIADFEPYVMDFITFNSPQSRASLWEFSHSPGVLDYLRSATGEEVPSPRFEPDILEKQMRGEVDEEEDEDAEVLLEMEGPEDSSRIAERAPHYASYPAFGLQECVAETGYPNSRIEDWLRSIEHKKQAILFGPPGTGKTFLAQRLARHLVGGTDGIIETLQFHPGYSYEEFMEGIRPITDGKGGFRFENKAGRFVEFCEEARKRSGPCVLILDEVNRANLSRVFGELMYLLEYRRQDMALAGGRRFSIPENVRLIGTMNTADRSIALVDFAMRRRFAFLELAPEYEILRSYQGRKGFKSDGLIETIQAVNSRINDRHYDLGVSFFMVEGLEGRVEAIWKTEIEPYLEEYFFGQPEAVESFRWRRVAERILPTRT